MTAGQITEFPLRRGWVLRLTDAAGDAVDADDRARSPAQDNDVDRKPARIEASSLQYGLAIGCLSIINVLAFLEVVFK